MKQRIRLTEGQLHNIIKNCVNEAIDGINGRGEAFEEIERLKEMLGADTLIDEMCRWMSLDEEIQFIEHIKRMYEIEDDDQEEATILGI